MKTFSKPNLWLALLLLLATPTTRADEEQDLIAVLQSTAGVPQKSAACQRLRVIGTAKAVPALAALLGEERTAHAARYALEGLPFAEAGAALRQALAQTSGPLQAGLVESLGWRRDTAAVPLLIPLLGATDPTIASASAAALGRIGGKEAAAALAAARNQATPAVQAVVCNSLLQCAEQLLSSGDSPGALALVRDLTDPKTPAHIRAAAWRCRLRADPANRPQLLTQALADQDRPIFLAALKAVRELDDPVAIKACMDQWPTLAEAAQLAVLEAQLPSEAAARPAVHAATSSPHLSVRIAAWQALGNLGDASSIPALASAAAQGEAAERDAARDTLARLRGDGVRESLLAQLSTAAAPEKAELLRALGERGDVEAASVLLQNAGSSTEPVRLAALESLRKLSAPSTLTPLLDLAATARSDTERDPVLRALVAVCQASRDRDQTSREVVAALGRFPAAQRRQILPLLAQLATPAALDAAQAATRDADLELVKEAVRVLSQWPNAAPAPRLLELAATASDPTLQTLALRGAIEVAGFETDPGKRLVLLRQAMAAAKRPDERKQALAQIGQTPTAEALDLALAHLTQPDLANEAGLAALSIAEQLAGKDPQRAAGVASEVLKRSKSPDIVKRAWALRGKSPGGGPFIQDWLVCGPYRQAGATTALALFTIPFGPEKSNERVEWKPAPRADMVTLSGIFPDQLSCVAYLKTTVIAPEAGEAALLLGSDDGIQAWLNGAVVHGNNVDRGATPDQDLAPITLRKGANELLLKVTQGGGGWAACARIVGTDGQPIPGLKVQAGP